MRAFRPCIDDFVQTVLLMRPQLATAADVLAKLLKIGSGPLPEYLSSTGESRKVTNAHS